jgi:hypothetical protein
MEYLNCYYRILILNIKLFLILIIQVALSHELVLLNGFDIDRQPRCWIAPANLIKYGDEIKHRKRKKKKYVKITGSKPPAAEGRLVDARSNMVRGHSHFVRRQGQDEKNERG